MSDAKSMAKKEPDIPASFATLYHAAMAGAPMPPSVKVWAQESAANAFVVSEMIAEFGRGGTQDMALRLLDEILADIGGK